MALADLVPGAWEIIREEYRAEGRIEGRTEGWKDGRLIQKKETIIKMLNKKLKNEPSKKILEHIEEASVEKLDKIEEAIFEITSWEEVEDIIK